MEVIGDEDLIWEEKILKKNKKNDNTELKFEQKKNKQEEKHVVFFKQLLNFEENSLRDQGCLELWWERCLFR
jgi:hypothetical protein